MAGDTRTLKLAILADTANLVAGLKKSENEVEGFGDKLGRFGKVAGAAFAAAGAAAAAYAGKLAVDGVKAAIEDEAAQQKLALTLSNVTGATQAQIAATEDYITKTTLASGVTDDELRPSLERLARATGDVEKAQKLQALALDIAAGTGKDLESVSNSLAKAYEGNTAALGKLGVGLTKAELATMSFDQITAKLADTFEGQASAKADTFQGKMQRLSVAFSEAKETVGSYILNAITPLVTGLVNNVIPSLSKTAETLGTQLGPAFTNFGAFIKETLIPILKEWWTFVSETVWPGIAKTLTPIIKGLSAAFSTVSDALVENEDKLKPLFDLLKEVGQFIFQTLAPTVGKVLGTAFEILGKAISVVVNIIAGLVNGINSAISAFRDLINLVKNNPITKAASGIIDGFRANGGPVAAGGAYVVGERGPELFVPRQAGTIIPNGATGANITINVTGTMLDPEGVAREVSRVMQSSAGRTGSYPTLGLNPIGLTPVVL